MTPALRLLVALATPMSLLALAAGACTYEPGSETARGGLGEEAPVVDEGVDGGVLVLGDSLTNGARLFGDLGDRLDRAGFDDLEILAEDGVPVPWAIEEVEERRSVPEVVVIELGTNPGASTAGFADDIDELVAAFRARGAEHIAWLTPAHGEDDRYEDKAELLEDADGIDLVADWAARVSRNPDRYATDGLHPSRDGYHDLARFIVNAAVEVAEN